MLKICIFPIGNDSGKETPIKAETPDKDKDKEKPEKRKVNIV